MTMPPLDALAAELGLQQHWRDAKGHERTVGADDMRHMLTAMGWPCADLAQTHASAQQVHQRKQQSPPLITATAADARLPAALPGATLRVAWEQGGTHTLRRQRDGTWPPLPPTAPWGYHRIAHAHGEVTLALAPPRCFGVQDLPGKPPHQWGLVAQIPSLRTGSGGGFGDFGALERCVQLAADAGANALAVSPTHAMFSADPAHCSPYSPSSRQFLNVLYIEPRHLFSAHDIAAAAAAIDNGNDANVDTDDGLIDWPAASRRKLALLRALHDRCRAREPVLPLCYDAQDRAHVHACFEALHAHLSRHAGHVLALSDWPPELASPRTPAVAQFACTHAVEIGFQLWLQRLAGRSLAHVQTRARAAGMTTGLLADLAVGSDPGGSDAWALQGQLFTGLGIGAPPDAFNPHGQNWGLTSFTPLALRAHGYAPWLRMLRATLRHAGGLRIDHVMGLARLWLVPNGAEASAGAYVHMPARDLLRLLALESWRHHAVIIGEDLGTVPPRLRQGLRGAGLLGLSVLWFERAGDRFLAPEHWPGDAVAMSTTHDLPTLSGWWQGCDLRTDPSANASAPRAAVSARQARERDRHALWQSLHATAPGSIAAAGATPERVAQEPAPPPRTPERFVDAACAALARTPSPLLLLPLEDLLGDWRQVNVPGAPGPCTNWRQRERETIDAAFARPDVRRRLGLLGRQRP